MDYYRRFPGDYARDTALLSILEHGVYTLLLDYQYATERSIIRLTDALKIAHAHTEEERAAVKVIYENFFPGGINPRFSKELKHTNERRLQLKRASEQGVAARRHGQPYGQPYGQRNGLPQPDIKTKRGSDLSFSQDHLNGEVQEAEEEEEEATAAAAFSALQLDEPFGSKAFQNSWCKAYAAIGNGNGHGFADAMERCIEECKAKGIKIPGRWFVVKRAVEKLEASQMYRPPTPH